MSNNIHTLGETADESLHTVRDALHVPVVFAKVASSTLEPGQHIGITPDGFTTPNNIVGIIDPFLELDPERGDIVAVLVFPNTVTNVRHSWEHPLLPTASRPDSQPSQAKEGDAVDWDTYLTGIASRLEISKATLLDAADWQSENGYAGSQAEHNWDEAAKIDWTEFWRRYNAHNATLNHVYGTPFFSSEDPFCC